ARNGTGNSLPGRSLELRGGLAWCSGRPLVTMLIRRSTRRWFSPFFCATVSVALGAAYMYAAGAPSYYLLVNFSALAAGLLAASIVRSALVLNQQVVGTFTVAVGLVLLATALVGHDVDGASRWIRLAGIAF